MMFKKIAAFIKAQLKGKSITDLAIRGIKTVEAVKLLFKTNTASDVGDVVKKLFGGLKQLDADKIREMLCVAIDNLNIVEGIESKLHLEEKLFALQQYLMYKSSQQKNGVYKNIAIEFAKMTADDAGIAVPTHILDLAVALEYANVKNKLGEEYV